MLYFFEPFWALWLGVVIWRGAGQSAQRVEAATAG